MKIQPRITGISETGSKVDIAVIVDGVEHPAIRLQVDDMMEGGETIENCYLLARYQIRQMMRAMGTNKNSIEMIQSGLHGVELEL